MKPDQGLGVGDPAVGEAGGGIVEGPPLDRHVGLLRPIVGGGYRLELGGHEDVHVLVTEPHGVVHAGEELEVEGPEADLLLELAGGRLERGLAVDIALAGGNLDDVVVQRRPILAYEHDIVAVDATTATAPGW